MTKNKLERKGFICLILPHHMPSLKEVKAGTQGRYLEKGTKSRPQSNTAYLLVFVFNATQNYFSKDGSPDRKCALYSKLQSRQ